MNEHGSLLGRQVAHPQRYAPDLLEAIPRLAARSQYGLTADALPFIGADLWRAYEISWLTPGGKPVVAVGELIFDARLPDLVESKSLKLYLNSLNQEIFATIAEVEQRIAADLTTRLGGVVQVRLQPLASYRPMWQELPGELLDELDVVIGDYTPQPEHLRLLAGEVVEQQLYSHLLRSNCPVTGQPDWGSVLVDYQGLPIDRPGLLAYLVSYRCHSGFHEACTEQIFIDILTRCQPQRLTVATWYLRRGGLEINCWRSTHETAHHNNLRLSRQ